MKSSPATGQGPLHDDYLRAKEREGYIELLRKAVDCGRWILPEYKSGRIIAAAGVHIEW